MEKHKIYEKKLMDEMIERNKKEQNKTKNVEVPSTLVINNIIKFYKKI